MSGVGQKKFMPTYIPPVSAVFAQLFGPVVASFSDSKRQYDCCELTDLDFLEMGISRSLSESRTGRDFIQRHGDHGRKQISVDLFFKGLLSARRLENVRSINQALSSLMARKGADPFASMAELDDFALYAGDGHFHSGAVHDPVSETRDGVKRKLPSGHFFTLNLRNHHLDHLALAAKDAVRKGEHDMHAIKRTDTDALRGREPKGRKVILVWDKAGIDFSYWHHAKHCAGLYFLSREKENMRLIRCGDRLFDRDDPRNAGVVADENVGPGAGGAMFRRITYLDPLTDISYTYITTEMTLPPGLLVLLYKHRWDIEKVFDELKSKLEERKSWASSPTAKTLHGQFLCLTHNLMVMLEEQILREEGVDNTCERERKNQRKQKDEKGGANFISTALQRFTVRSLKFIRWLRNFLYRNARWDLAIARLRQVYAQL
jgi:hypothetical protein